tara:strand:+ start:171 stop:578 length:408 start_codon:yes stop_codon:yes gene_type:complete
MFEHFTFEPLSILAATLLVVVLNAAWYAPFAFGKMWLQHHQRLKKKLPEAKLSIVFTLCSQILTLWIVSALQNGLGIDTFNEGVLLGFVLGLGLIAPFSAANAVYFGLPMQLWGLDFSHHLLVLAFSSGVLAAFH